MQVLYCIQPFTETWDVSSPTPWIYLSAHPSIQSESRTIIKKDSRTVLCRLHQLQIFTHLREDLWVSWGAEKLRTWSTWPLSYSSLCCLQLQPPLEDSIHPLVLLRNCIPERARSRVSDAACDHSPWLRVLLRLASVQLSTHSLTTHTSLTPTACLPACPPIKAVHSASHGVGRTIDPAEMMVSKREAVSMSALPSSTVEGPWDITELSTLHHHRMGKWDFHCKTSWGEGNSSHKAMFSTEDVKRAFLPSDASYDGPIRSF